jgi:hypothetical protein
MTDQPDTEWHLDKRVPLALIATLSIQTLLAVWWAADLSNSVTALQASDARQDGRIEAMRDAAQQMAVQLGRIEEISLNTQKAVEGLARQLEARP